MSKRKGSARVAATLDPAANGRPAPEAQAAPAIPEARTAYPFANNQEGSTVHTYNTRRHGPMRVFTEVAVEAGPELEDIPDLHLGPDLTPREVLANLTRFEDALRPGVARHDVTLWEGQALVGIILNLSGHPGTLDGRCHALAIEAGPDGRPTLVRVVKGAEND